MSLQIQHISKQYRGSNTPALTDFSMSIKPGILGLLGPNGAGKSTLMRIIATITKPTNGTILWNGEDVCKKPDSIRKNLGYLPQDFGVYPNLNAVEFLRYMAALKGLKGKGAKKRIDDLLAIVNLYEARKRPLGEYSGGMKQRIGVAQALLNDPKILIVDEPTVGLDPEGRVRFRHLLAELARDRVVILSTHIVSDVEAIANDIAIINNGRLIIKFSPEEMLKIVQGKVWDWAISSVDLPKVRQQYILSRIIRQEDGLHVRVVADDKPGQGAQQSMTSTLEEAYLYYIASNRGDKNR